MPKTAIDYSKTQIYKLKHKDDYNDENIYVGHTTNWVKRKYHHNWCCKSENNKEYGEKKYKYIRENGGWDEWIMDWIENYPCNNEREAQAREQYHIDLNNSRLNEVRAFTTQEEHRERRREYKEENKEKLKEDNKNWYENNKGNHRQKAKKWYDNNQDKVKEKITCECGCIDLKYGLKRHITSKKHIEGLNKNIVLY
jgi:hypothetical protein